MVRDRFRNNVCGGTWIPGVSTLDGAITRGRIGECLTVGNIVAICERTYWIHGGEEVSQALLAVYETCDCHIRRAWYYPVG